MKVDRVVKVGSFEEGELTASTFFHAHNKPILALDVLSADSVRDTQEESMQILAGAMTGIRNPKVYANIVNKANRLVRKAKGARGRLGG